jgi:hypothetical protein
MLEGALTELEGLLAEEREAIRKLDGARVIEFATRKQVLVAALTAERGAMTKATAARLRALTPALRHNGILLAHARDVLRDAIAAARAESVVASHALPPPGGPALRTLSVRG